MSRRQEWAEEQAERLLPWYRERAERLHRFASDVFEGTQTVFQGRDSFGFMVLSYVSRQRDHMDSLLELIPGRDALLIARSMIDGMIQLKWASLKPEERQERWRAFVYAHDWKLLLTTA